MKLGLPVDDGVWQGGAEILLIDQGEGDLRAHGSSGYGITVTGATVPCREQAVIRPRILGVVTSCLTEILELAQESLLSLLSLPVRGVGTFLLLS